MPRKFMLLTLVVMLDGSPTHAEPLQFRVVDAASGRPLSGVTVTRWSSTWQPHIPLCFPKRYWFPGESDLMTDHMGLARFEKSASDDFYYFKADGYATVGVTRKWFRYKISEEPYEKSANADQRDGAYLVPLRRK